MVARVEEDFSPHHWNPKTISVISDTFYNAFYQPFRTWMFWIAKSQTVQLCNRSCTHRENISIDTTHTSSCTLIRLNCRRMIVTLNLKCATYTIPQIDDARVLFASFYKHLISILRERFKPFNGILVRAVFTPHHRVYAHFREIRGAAKYLFDGSKLISSQAHILSLFQGSRSSRGGHSRHIIRYKMGFN